VSPIHRIYGANSLWLRQRHLAGMQSIIAAHPLKRMPDVGGHPWRRPVDTTRVHVKLTLRNLEFPADTSDKSLSLVTGDGCAPSFAEGELAVVFSKNAIGHVGT